ncbi:MAG: hypothetical protein V3T70_09505 [Phycisphaerae bacterium]
MAISNDRTRHRHSFAATFLRWAAGVAAAAAILVGVADLSASIQAGETLGWRMVGRLGVWLFVAIAAGGVLAGVAVAIDLLRSLVLSSQRQEERGRDPLDTRSMHASDSNDPRAAPPSGDAAAPPWREMTTLLNDIRDTLLLPEDQRAERRQHLMDEDLRRSSEQIHELLAAGQLLQAQGVLDRLRRRFPKRSEIGSLDQAIEASRAAALEQDIATYTKRVDELMSISAWERAGEAARELADRHPGNEVVAQLVDRIERERQLFESEQRQRMYAEIQRYVSRKRWREALVATDTFVERFPKTDEAETLRVQATTLRTNAEIEERQTMESEITGLAKHGRYIEAYNLALHLVQQFPQSPQADALRNQLPRLKELAHNPNAAPARVRIN